MSNYIIREMTEADWPQAAALWHTVFGDDEALVMEFFRLFSAQPYFAACAEKDGEIVAAAYCPQGTDYVSPDGTVRQGAYLYAVATHPDHRKQGLAMDVCRWLRMQAFRQGMDYMFTKPSEESLYPWYEEKIEAYPVLGGQQAVLERAGGGTLPVRTLSPEEYGQQRETLLSGLPHVRHSLAWLEWENLLHQYYGGGFYAVGDRIATLYQDGAALQIGELLPRPTTEAVQSLLTALHADKCTCTFHGEGHYVSVTAKDGVLPADNPWFGPCYG